MSSRRTSSSPRRALCARNKSGGGGGGRQHRVETLTQQRSFLWGTMGHACGHPIYDPGISCTLDRPQKKGGHADTVIGTTTLVSPCPGTRLGCLLHRWVQFSPPTLPSSRFIDLFSYSHNAHAFRADDGSKKKKSTRRDLEPASFLTEPS